MYILLWNINMKIWPTITPIYDNYFFNMLSQQQHINMQINVYNVFNGKISLWKYTHILVYGNTHIA